MPSLAAFMWQHKGDAEDFFPQHRLFEKWREDLLELVEFAILCMVFVYHQTVSMF